MAESDILKDDSLKISNSTMSKLIGLKEPDFKDSLVNMTVSIFSSFFDVFNSYDSIGYNQKRELYRKYGTASKLHLEKELHAVEEKIVDAMHAFESDCVYDLLDLNNSYTQAVQIFKSLGLAVSSRCSSKLKFFEEESIRLTEFKNTHSEVERQAMGLAKSLQDLLSSVLDYQPYFAPYIKQAKFSENWSISTMLTNLVDNIIIDRENAYLLSELADFMTAIARETQNIKHIDDYFVIKAEELKLAYETQLILNGNLNLGVNNE